MYLGDNMRADLVEARRWHGWHTGCIIGELDDEIEIQRSLPCKEKHFLRSTLRSLIYDLQAEMQHPNSDAYPAGAASGGAAPTGASAKEGNELSNQLLPCRTKNLFSGQHFNRQEEALWLLIKLYVLSYDKFHCDCVRFFLNQKNFLFVIIVFFQFL